MKVGNSMACVMELANSTILMEVDMKANGT
jgi:hypothetical protein